MKFFRARLHLIGFCCGLLCSASALAIESNPHGHLIGSSGFDEMLGQKLGADALKTVALPDGSFKLYNTVQTLSAHITSQGVNFDSIGNSSGKGGFMLSLLQWGRENNLQKVQSSKIYSDNNFVYQSHAFSFPESGIVEKFSNTSSGIRQDFVVPVKPQGDSALHVRLQVKDGVVKAGANGVLIALKSGRQLTYDRLIVTDSAGKNIPAQMMIAANNVIDVVVEDAAAVYPLTIDPTVGDENWVSMGALLGTETRVTAMVRFGSDIYIAGWFTVAGDLPTANHIVKWDGSKWGALGTGLIGNTPLALAVDSTGNLYAGGLFATAGGVLVNNIAKWNGSTWSALGTGTTGLAGTGYVTALAVDTNDNVYVGGEFNDAGGVAVNNIAKWDGSNWSALGVGVNSKVFALTADKSGNIYAGGWFNSAGGVAANHIAKWDGSAWSALGSGLTCISCQTDVNALVVDNNNNLYAGGSFNNAGGVTAIRVAKWNGTAWSSLGSSYPDVAVYALAVDSNNNLYMAGAGDNYSHHINKWDGATLSLLGAGIIDDIYALVVDSSDNLYVGGEFDRAGGIGVNDIAKWNGVSWSALGTTSMLNYLIYAATFDNQGNLYVGGAFANGILKWNGSTWSNVGSGIPSFVKALAADANNNIYAGGTFYQAGGVPARHVAKWNGSSWSALGAGIDDSAFFSSEVYALLVDDVGNLYVGGAFAGGNIRKWNGVTWSAVGSGSVDLVHALVKDSHGNIYTGYGKWDGSSWSSLGTGVSGGQVSSLAIDSSDNLYAGGQFTSAGGVPNTRNIAKWDGSAWSALGAGMSVDAYDVRALALDANGSLYAGGSFITAGGVTADHIAKWDGTEWSALGTGIGLGGGYVMGVFTLVVDVHNNLYAGGDFKIAGNKVSAYLARWKGGADPNADADADYDGVPDATDNCPSIANADQTDTDGDSTGDACDATPNGDSDSDGDGIDDLSDNCPTVANADQTDSDGDGTGNACDNTPNGDSDGDGVDNLSDNCPAIANADQKNTDGDSAGDACDTTPNGDSDSDGIDNRSDNCPSIANTDQKNTDGDSAGDACDSTPNGDSDGDGVDNLSDNCPAIANADQKNTDGDSAGDACDTTPNGDDDGDGIDNLSDILPNNPYQCSKAGLKYARAHGQKKEYQKVCKSVDGWR